MPKPAFPGLEPVRYRGPDAEGLAYRFYDKDRIVRGKRMEDQLRLAVCYWHTLCGDGSDVFGAGTFNRAWQRGDDAVALANQLAPEHCEVMTRNPGNVSRGILTAGAVFLGQYSPTVLGDYVAGPSHTLPTGGAGASFAGLTIDQFQRRTSVVEYNRASLRKALPTVREFAGIEGLSAHGKSAEVRWP